MIQRMNHEIIIRELSNGATRRLADSLRKLGTDGVRHVLVKFDIDPEDLRKHPRAKGPGRILLIGADGLLATVRDTAEALRELGSDGVKYVHVVRDLADVPKPAIA